MTSVADALSAKGQMAADLAAGLAVLTQNEQLTFQSYDRWSNPLDGTVFWILDTKTAPLVVNGSLHVSQDQDQIEDETASVNRVIFTATQAIGDFAQIDPDSMWLCSYGELTIAFNSRSMYFQQADLHHYSGVSVMPAMMSQIVKDASQFVQTFQVVSNSLPFWLYLNVYDKPYSDGLTMPVTLYPSFLVPENMNPPYGVVHIEPGETVSSQGASFLDQTLGHWQLAQDNVRITLYGMTNDLAVTFLDFVLQYSYDWNTIGVINTPVIRDEKRFQTEISTIAMKKTIEFQVSYQQYAARNIVRQLITKSLQTYLPQPLVAGDVAYLD